MQELDPRLLPMYGEYVMLVSASTGGARWGQVVDVAPPFVILRGAVNPHDSPLRGWDRLNRITIRARNKTELQQQLLECKHYKWGQTQQGNLFCSRCSVLIGKEDHHVALR